MSRESEAQTRKERVDKLLEKAGWKVVPYSEGPLDSFDGCAVEEYPTSSGPADYALVNAGRIVGIVEAKRVSKSPQEILEQARRYSRGVENSPFTFGEYGVPFIYATNGEIIWHQDLRQDKSRSRKVSLFHTPDALEETLTRDVLNACSWFGENPNPNDKLRYYQIEANDNTEQAIADGKRQMLLAMATGTGKTYTMVSQIYRLMKSGVGKRILFLVDRRALAAQAVQAFATYEAEPGQKFDKIYEVYSQSFKREDFEDEKFDPKVLPNNYLTSPGPEHTFVYVCTIQRMRINLFGWESSFESNSQDSDDESDAGLMDIPIHAFDVIIADECHRGYTSKEASKWREVLDHFDAIKIGLTATPAAHTTAFFKDIVYRYELDKAIQDGYLVDYDAVSIKSDVRMNGMFLKEGELVELMDTTTGRETYDMLEDEREFDVADVEKKVTSPDSNKKIVKEIAKYAREHEDKYGRFPKTLIFAANDLDHISHCDRIVDMCRDEFGRGDGFVKKITGKVDRPLQRIREFRNIDEPAIVVTRDLLSTGVDIPSLEYIVFLRPVKSRILWEQMLGRGTRRSDEIGKTHFTVFDCFDGTLFAYFKNASVFDMDAPEKSSRTHKQVIEDIYQNRDRDYNTRCLVRRLQRIDKNITGEGREEFERFIEGGDIKSFASGLPTKIENEFNAVMEILRDPDFQDLMLNYKRPEKTFIIAPEQVDDVSSEFLVRGPDGAPWKPEDYLLEFSRYVKENPEHIQAIEILLERPRDWSTDALNELREKLKTTKERFTEDNLQKAHKAKYQKELADIISMIKHAAKEEEPILSAQERVDRAVSKITEGTDFTEQQLKWLERIRGHLIENLTIGKEDFELPIFDREGGWNVANKAFDNNLETLLKEFNEAVAT
jgi:type I restriction enzyme R subunit